MPSFGFNSVYPLVFLSISGVWLLAAMAYSAKQGRRRKEMEHLEHLKAMEMGLVPPLAGLNWPGAMVCIAIGAGVPIGSFFVTLLAALHAPVSGGIWVAPVFVSLAAIGAARKLACRMMDSRSKSNKPALGESTPLGKPAFDPDAFDVVGSRG